MITLALYVHLEAKPGKEEELAQMLRSAQALVEQESGTITWYAMRMGPTTFGIFDTFESEQGRDAHLQGQVAAALQAKGDELLAKPFSIDKVEIIASK